MSSKNTIVKIGMALFMVAMVGIAPVTALSGFTASDVDSTGNMTVSFDPSSHSSGATVVLTFNSDMAASLDYSGASIASNSGPGTATITDQPDTGSNMTVEYTVDGSETGEVIIDITGLTASADGSSTVDYEVLDSSGSSLETGSNSFNWVATSTSTSTATSTATSDSGSVSGNVTDTDTGNALSGEVLIEDQNSDFQTTVQIASDDGSYQATDLSPSDYDVTAQVDGYETVTKSVTISSGSDQVVDFALAEHTMDSVDVTVEDDGTAVEGATVELYELDNNGDRVNPDNPHKTGTTDADGHYSFADVADGEYEVVAVDDSIDASPVQKTVSVDASDDDATNALTLDFQKQNVVGGFIGDVPYLGELANDVANWVESTADLNLDATQFAGLLVASFLAIIILVLAVAKWVVRFAFPE